MSSVFKVIVAAVVACGISSLAAAGTAAAKCVGCSTPVAGTSQKTVYKTRVAYAVRDVTVVRNVTRVHLVTAAPHHGRALTWPGENHPSTKYCR